MSGHKPFRDLVNSPVTDPQERGVTDAIERHLIVDLDRRRVRTLAKCAILLSTMAGAGVETDDSADLYGEVIMALGIEDQDSPDSMAAELVEHPDSETLIGRITAMHSTRPVDGDEQEAVARMAAYFDGPLRNHDKVSVDRADMALLLRLAKQPSPDLPSRPLEVGEGEVTEALWTVEPAWRNLRDYQEQADMHGERVTVSRQALDEVLDAIDHALAVSPAGQRGE